MNIEARPIRLSPVGKLITLTIVVVLTIVLVRAAGRVMTPFVAAAITAYLFNPLIRWLHRVTRISRVLWIIVLYVLLGALLYGITRFLGPIIIAQYRELRHQVPSIVNAISREIIANRMIDIGGFTVDMAPIEEPLLAFIAEVGRSLPAAVPHLFLTAVEAMLLFVTYLIVTFYFLLQADSIVEQAYGLVPAPYRVEIRTLGQQIDRVLGSYIRGTLLLIPIMSVLTYIALTILEVRYALVIAIATGFLEIIPLIGPWSAALIAMSMALFQATTPFGWSNGLLALVVGITYFVLRMFEDNFIIPHVLGHAVHLHPVLVLFAILAGGAIGGPFGLLVSIPVVAVVRLLLRYLYGKLVDSPELLLPGDVGFTPEPTPPEAIPPHPAPAIRPED